MTALLLSLLSPVGSAAQVLRPEPDPFAVSIGVEAVFPAGALAGQDPNADTWYATSGTALIQRVAWAPTASFAFVLEAAFPRFGMDADALQRDFGSAPPVISGKHDISSVSVGVRWRGSGDWLSGPFAEASAGRFRQRTETTQEGDEAQSVAFEWEFGLTGTLGWTTRVGPAFAVEVSAAYHRFREENRGTTQSTGEPFVNRWVDQLTGVRLLAIVTFGGDG